MKTFSIFLSLLNLKSKFNTEYVLKTIPGEGM